ncbi:hypothetical protein L1987_75085 [Smallanthus sonchifolius]|uniref:Uncharacterized protein n=1 Tax=Smallanthus sonchifolius TaxID=185202 RepID=A0ACB9A4G6_9ASTR|nr:hypothetical protein L1987_75085 [Smallanthus sonchifolius]
MDVLSLLKFWRNAGFPDFGKHEPSFFDLQLTNQYHQFSNFNGTDSNSHPFNKKRRILPLDSSNTKTPRRSNENVRLPEESPVHAFPATAPVFSPRKEEKRLGGTVFKEVRKHWGKSRSSSSEKPAPAPVMRSDDDSALQQDGIQSAILHCKKSYDSPSRGCHVLSRSGSAPSEGPRISIDEIKRSSI